MATTKTSTLSPLSDIHLVTDKITMSSVEIAELTGKQHKHVKTDIVKLLNELELRHADFSESLKNNQNQSVLVYNLPKRECLVLISGYSIKMRAAIIDRWQALEDQQTPAAAPQPQQLFFKGESIPLFIENNQRYLPLEKICRLLNISYYNSVRRIAAQNLQLHTINAQMCIDTQAIIAWLDGIDLRHYKLIKRQQLIKDIQALRSTILSPQAPTNPHNEPLSMQYLLEKLEEVVGEPVLITTKKKAIKAVQQVGKVDAAIIDTFNLTEYSRLLSNQSAVVNQLFSGKNVYYLNSKRKLA